MKDGKSVQVGSLAWFVSFISGEDEKETVIVRYYDPLKEHEFVSDYEVDEVSEDLKEVHFEN